MIKPSSAHFQHISGGTHPQTGTKFIFAHEGTFGEYKLADVKVYKIKKSISFEDKILNY